MVEKNILSQCIKKLAYSLGIDIIEYAEAAEFQRYILKNSKRRDPKLSLSDSKSIIVIGIYISGIVLPSWNMPNIGRISRLFLYGFLNDIVKQLEPVASLLHKESYNAIICDDSKNEASILPLKLAAIRAGLGWQGKNSLLVTKKYGSFLALGGILTNATLVYNRQEEVNLCKSCNKCQQACPMKALEQAYVLNKNICLPYLLQNDNLHE